MMTTLLIIIHVIVSLFLIAVVLLQSGKGAELGAAFGGGSSHTLFGSRGAATFLNKMTTVAAVVFMITSLTLAVVTSKGGSVVKKTPVTEGTKSIPAPSGPIQGVGVQPSAQPSPQQVPQKTPQQQKIPQPQQTPTK
jgi:preprotein translocase subunit SecG